MSLRVERYVEDFNPRERMLVANRFTKLGTLFHTSALGIRQGEMCDRPICHLHPFPRISKPTAFLLVSLPISGHQAGQCRFTSSAATVDGDQQRARMFNQPGSDRRNDLLSCFPGGLWNYADSRRLLAMSTNVRTTASSPKALRLTCLRNTKNPPITISAATISGFRLCC